MSSDPHQSPEADLRRRKRRGWLIIVACFAGLFSLFGWSLFGPNPPLVISKQTTYITSPLRPDGTPDYEAYLLSKQNRKLPREDNAAVVMLQVFGPALNWYGPVNEESWRLWQKEFGDLTLPQGLRRLSHLNQNETLEASFSDWIESRKDIGDGESSDLFVDSTEAVDVAIRRRWKDADVPPLSSWLSAIKPTLDYALQGSQRPQFCLANPQYLNGRPDNLSQISLPGAGALRSLAKLHCLYANLCWGESDFEIATQHYQAALNWAEHGLSGEWVSEQTNSIGMFGMVYDPITGFACDEHVPVAILKTLRDAVQATPLQIPIETHLNESARLMNLDTVLGVIRDPGIAEGLSWEEDRRIPRMAKMRIDENLVLKIVNEWNDRLITVARISEPHRQSKNLSRLAAQIAELDKEHKRETMPTYFDGIQANSDSLGEVLVTWLLQVGDSLQAVHRYAAQRQLTLVTLALAIHRAEQGAYPEKLSDLVPPLAATLQVDTFQGKPLGYKRTDDGFLLYSLGPNGIDDGGDCHADARIVSGGVSKKAGIEIDAPNAPIGLGPIKETADDFSVRLPRPLEPWPWEVNAAHLKAMEESGASVEPFGE